MFVKRNCDGCCRKESCLVLHPIINYRKIRACPCGMCLVKAVCKNNPCKDYGTFYREVWEIYMIAFKEQREYNYYDK